MTTRIVTILVFDGFEPLDAVGPFEAFIAASTEDNEPFFDVGLVARDRAPVTATGGLVVTPRWSFDDLPRPDILVVPGGQGTRALVEDREAIDWIVARDRESEMTLSVCTGAQVLAAAGLLRDLRATTHWATYDWLAALEPSVEIAAGARWADNGRIVCSSGVSAGIDMALHVIARLHGHEAAARAARDMEYDHWRPEKP